MDTLPQSLPSGTQGMLVSGPGACPESWLCVQARGAHPPSPGYCSEASSPLSNLRRLTDTSPQAFSAHGNGKRTVSWRAGGGWPEALQPWGASLAFLQGQLSPLGLLQKGLAV